MKSVMFVLTSFFFSLSIWSGHEVGNGGDILRCKDKITLFDFHESTTNGFKKFKASDRDYLGTLEQVLDKFKKVDSKLANQYIKRSKSIYSEISFEDNVTLTDVKDSVHASLPKGCELKQIAIRLKAPKKMADGTERNFIIDKGLWNKLTVEERAGLILHEIIYEHLVFLGERDSRKARYLNGLISHVAAGEKLPKPFSKILRELKLPIYR